MTRSAHSASGALTSGRVSVTAHLCFQVSDCGAAVKTHQDRREANTMGFKQWGGEKTRNISL